MSNVYHSIIQHAYMDYPTDVPDLVQDSPLGGIDMPSDELYKVHALSSTHPPPHRPASPLKPQLRQNLCNLGSKTHLIGMMAPCIYHLRYTSF